VRRIAVACTRSVQFSRLNIHNVRTPFIRRFNTVAIGPLIAVFKIDFPITKTRYSVEKRSLIIRPIALYDVFVNTVYLSRVVCPTMFSIRIRYGAQRRRSLCTVANVHTNPFPIMFPAYCSFTTLAGNRRDQC